MNKGPSTKEILLTQAKTLFWTRGYSNVSVREIANAAGVDVALINRYYDSKFGLFCATLATLEGLDHAAIPTPEVLVESLVGLFTTTPHDGSVVSPVTMILMNANDPEVGEMVIKGQYDKWQCALVKIIGDETRAALFLAAVMGFSVVAKTLRLQGIAPVGSQEYGEQLRHMLTTALEYGDGS